MGVLLRRLFPAAEDEEQVDDGDGAGLDQSPPDLKEKRFVCKTYTTA